MSRADAIAETTTLRQQGQPGIACRSCGIGTLEQTSCDESAAGALHTHVRCPHCRAHGCLSVNMPGAKPIVERGPALRGERR